jgi:hypothetical protein
MGKIVSIPLIMGVLCLVASPGSIGAAEQPDPTLAFRSPAGEERRVSMGTWSLTPRTDAGSSLLAHTPMTLRSVSSLQVAQAAGASGMPAVASPAAGEAEGQSLTEINKQLSNPVTSLWSLSFQFNNYYLANHRWNYNLQFQPVLPVSLTRDWNLITRPVVPLYNSVPVPTGPGTFSQRTGLGDTILLEMLSPANTGPWLLGAGPTFIFPTATNKYTGQGKWQSGPAAFAGYLSKEFIVGLFPQQWWSIGGSNGRPYTSQMNLQPVAAWFFAPGWNLGYSGNILANWNAPSRDVWTVPIGLGIGRVVRLGPLPLKFTVAGQWMAVHPGNTGQEWNIQIQITPVIPKLIKGTLFE